MMNDIPIITLQRNMQRRRRRRRIRQNIYCLALVCWTALVQESSLSIGGGSLPIVSGFGNYIPCHTTNERREGGRRIQEGRYIGGSFWYSYHASSSSSPCAQSTTSCSSSSSSTTTEVSSSSSSSSLPLESFTVKELRQMVKDSQRNERGVLSRLKLKKDLIAFLEETTEKDVDVDEDTPPSTINHDMEDDDSTATPLVTKNSQRTIPLGMPPSSSFPPKVLPKDLEEESSSTVSSSQSLSKHLNPKERIFEKVYERYPLVKDQNCTGIGDEDIRQQYHPMLEDITRRGGSSDMDIIFVGTASCTPGVTRGVTCTALRLNWKRRSIIIPDSSSPPPPPSTANEGRGIDGISSSFLGGQWLFDCGECTQLQVQRTPSIKPGKITKLFITHAHGDHSFGLPGLLCLMGQDRQRESVPIDIYGPEGLRMWLRVAIRYSVSRIVPPYRVHELKDIPMAPEWEFSRHSNRYFYRGLAKKDPRTIHWGYQGLAGEDPESWISRASLMNLEPNPRFGELEGGRDIFPNYGHPESFDGAPVWEVEDEEDVKVFAAPMSHGIPCVGYVVKERTQPGRLRDELVRPIVERNLEALKEAGFKVPMKAMAVIKNLPIGSAFTFPDGTVVTQEEALEAPRRGRKVVICGDTANSRSLTLLGQDADVLIHEATNAYLPGIDKDTDFGSVTREAIVHGHSTPFMAGEFAKRIGARKLLLNHFSARYKGDQCVDSLSIMMRIEGQAIKASGLNTTDVAAAWDMMVLPVPRN